MADDGVYILGNEYGKQKAAKPPSSQLERLRGTSKLKTAELWWCDSSSESSFTWKCFK